MVPGLHVRSVSASMAGGGGAGMVTKVPEPAGQSKEAPLAGHARATEEPIGAKVLGSDCTQPAMEDRPGEAPTVPPGHGLRVNGPGQ